MRYDTFIFDLDGTLLNSLDDLERAVNHTLQVFHMPLRTKEEVKSFLGNGFKYLLTKAAPKGSDNDTIESMMQEFKRFYQQHCADLTRPYDGVLQMLQQLKSRGKKLAIVSNKGQVVVTPLAERFFKDSIDVVVGETEDIKRKPAPDTILYAMQRLDADPQTTCYIGDSEVDIEAAKNAHLPCLTCLWGFRTKAFLLEHGAETFLNEPNDLLQFAE